MAGQNWNQCLRRAVAHNVISVDNVSSDFLHQVVVGSGQFPNERISTQRIESKHKHVEDIFFFDRSGSLFCFSFGNFRSHSNYDSRPFVARLGRFALNPGVITVYQREIVGSAFEGDGVGDVGLFNREVRSPKDLSVSAVQLKVLSQFPRLGGATLLVAPDPIVQMARAVQRFFVVQEFVDIG